MKKVFPILIVAAVLASCTGNTMAKQYGGSMDIDIPEGQKLLNASWKESNVWYLTRTMKQTDSAENYIYKEVSAHGILEGTINFYESK